MGNGKLREMTAAPIRLSPLNPRQQEVIDIMKAAPPGSLSIIGYGGSKGGGKTVLLCRAAVLYAMYYPGSRLLLARDEYNKLETTTLQEFDSITSQMPGLVVKSFNQPPVYRDIRLTHWPPEIFSRVYFRGVANYLAFGSEAYSFIGLDEASEIDRRAAAYALTILRWRMPKKVERLFAARGIQEPYLPYILLAASNPFPGWFEDWFWAKKLDDILFAMPPDLQVKTHFVPARIKDNPYLPPGYEEQTRAALLSAGMGEWVERLIEGRFDVYEGKIYEHFSPDIHKWLKGYPQPDEYDRVIGGLDFGGESQTAHFTAGIVAVITKPQGRVIRVAEFKQRGPNITERLQAWMLAQQARWGDPIQKRIEWCADRSQSVGISQWKHVFNIRPSKGGRDSVDEGIKVVAARLEKDGSGYYGSYYLPELTQWEEEMRTYHRDPETMRVVEKNDDLCDADRYSSELLGRYRIDPAKLFANAMPMVR